MGRYPWKATVNRLEAAATGFADLTQQDRRRSFRRIGQVLSELEAKSKVATTNPAKIGEADVAAFLGWCANNLDASTARKYLRQLGEVLAYAGNGVLTVMKAKRVARFPKPAKKPIAAHAERTVRELLASCDRLPDEWWGQVAKAALALAAYSGVRPTELRLTTLADLDTLHWEVRVSHPKGLGRYATGEERSPIMQPAESILRDYLDVREVFLRRLGLGKLCCQVQPRVPHGRDLWHETHQQHRQQAGAVQAL